MAKRHKLILGDTLVDMQLIPMGTRALLKFYFGFLFIAIELEAPNSIHLLFHHIHSIRYIAISWSISFVKEFLFLIQCFYNGGSIIIIGEKINCYFGTILL